MGDVALIIKVMPKSPEVNRDAIVVAIKEKFPRVQDIREEPIGFGLVALKIALVIPDADGQTETIEETLSAIEGVERAEIVDSTLV